MSERMATDIEIGGPVPANLVTDLISQIDSEGLFVGWAEDSFEAKTAEDLLAYARRGPKPGTLHLGDFEVAWGRFPDLEDFLVENRISFDRRSDAKYEYDAELVRYRAGMKQPQVCYTLQDKIPVVPVRDLKGVRRALERGQASRALALLKSVLGPEVRPLEPLCIVDECFTITSRGAGDR